MPAGSYANLQSWTKLFGHFCVSGAFPIHTGPTPSLTPQTMLHTCIQNFFRVSNLYRVWGGRTARKFRTGCTALRGNREMTEKYEYCSIVLKTFVQDCMNPGFGKKPVFFFIIPALVRHFGTFRQVGDHMQ